MLNIKLSLAFLYSKVALAPSTVIPAPLAAAASADPFATVMFRSSTSKVAVFNVVVVPSTCKSPVTISLLPIVTISSESPIVTALLPNPPANLVLRFARDTSTSVLAICVLGEVNVTRKGSR